MDHGFQVKKLIFFLYPRNYLSFPMNPRYRLQWRFEKKVESPKVRNGVIQYKLGPALLVMNNFEDTVPLTQSAAIRNI